MTLPPIPKDRNWSPETWRAGLDEAVRRDPFSLEKAWESYALRYSNQGRTATTAHATTLLDVGIVKPVVSEAATAWDDAMHAYRNLGREAAIAVIQSALDKARAGE